MITVREKQNEIGKEGVLRVKEALFVKVKIIDVREVFGRLDYLVEAVAGSGEAWIDAQSFREGKV